jgi:2-keto-4-pentenoate hydratase/2-oxohepta-3-ene-1,7-dioic acid hydratase in catechol pathway
VCTLLPGDIIWTGTPAGVGNARTPKRMLAPGEVLTSYVDQVGEIHTTLVAGPTYPAQS